MHFWHQVKLPSSKMWYPWNKAQGSVWSQMWCFSTQWFKINTLALSHQITFRGPSLSSLLFTNLLYQTQHKAVQRQLLCSVVHQGQIHIDQEKSHYIVGTTRPIATLSFSFPLRRNPSMQHIIEWFIHFFCTQGLVIFMNLNSPMVSPAR